MVHDLAAVELGADGVELLLGPQLRDAPLELVHAAPRARARAALRVVQSRPGQLVEPVEQRPGVAHVAAHGPVGPAQPVGVEAQVELDQPGDDLDVLVAGSAAPCIRSRVIRAPTTSW